MPRLGKTSGMVVPNNLGRTAEGSYWVARALHPCDETKGGGAPIPDLTQTESANLEVRHFNNLSSPGNPAAGNWDCQIAVLPFVDSVVVYRRKLATDVAWGLWNMLDLRAGNIKPGSNAVDAGIVAQSALLPTLIADTTGFRQTFKGVTVIHNSSSLEDQGYVTVGQWGTTVAVEEMAHVFNDYAEPTDNPVAKFMVIRDIPTTPSDVMKQAPKSVAHKAREGVYLPMRFNQPVHEYQPATGYQVNITTGGTTGGEKVQTKGYPLMLQETTVESETELLANLSKSLVWQGTPTFTGTVAPGSPDNNPDTGTFYSTAGNINQNLGVAIFTGLDAKAELEVKSRTGIEMIPKDDRVAASFMTDAPMKDQMALDMVQSVQTKMPLALPERYNSLGAIVALIAKGVALVAPLIQSGVQYFRNRKSGGGLTNAEQMAKHRELMDLGMAALRPDRNYGMKQPW